MAADYYRRALDIAPADNRARVQLGAALVRSMQYEASLPVLNEALAREPNNYAAHANLATAFFTHLANVYLLYRCIELTTASPLLASFGASLWGAIIGALLFAAAVFLDVRYRKRGNELTKLRGDLHQREPQSPGESPGPEM